MINESVYNKSWNSLQNLIGTIREICNSMLYTHETLGGVNTDFLSSITLFSSISQFLTQFTGAHPTEAICVG